MTRINVIPACELSDQHLIAEYHELPRVLNQDINIADAPERYVLGKGHMKWAKRHIIYVKARYLQLIKEMQHRGFKTNWGLDDKIVCGSYSELLEQDYFEEPEDFELNRQRIREKYEMKPNWYRWTNRSKPSWL